jgi:hypothetical protein
MRIAGLVAALALAGCTSLETGFDTAVVASNATGAPVEILVKVWDPEGGLAFNATRTLSPGEGEVPMGRLQDQLDRYSGPFTWYAHDGTNTAQERISPLPGTSTVTVTVAADGIRFAYGT